MRILKFIALVTVLLVLSSCTIALDCTTVRVQKPYTTWENVSVREPVQLYDRYGNYVKTEYRWTTEYRQVTKNRWETEQVCNGITARGQISIR